MARNVDGLLVVDPQTDPRQPIQIEVPVPVVYAYAPSKNPDDYSVTCDNVSAGRMAVEYMLRCRRRKIAIICGDAKFQAATDRLSGALGALRDAGVELVGTPQFGNWGARWGRQETQRLLDDGVDFDALVCQSDVLAFGAMQTLQSAGLRVPQDVAVIGHDDWEILTCNTIPEMTTISNNTEGIGRVAGRLVSDAIAGKGHAGLTLVSCRIIERGSTPSVQ